MEDRPIDQLTNQTGFNWRANKRANNPRRNPLMAACVIPHLYAPPPSIPEMRQFIIIGDGHLGWSGAQQEPTIPYTYTRRRKRGRAAEAQKPSPVSCAVPCCPVSSSFFATNTNIGVCAAISYSSSFFPMHEIFIVILHCVT